MKRLSFLAGLSALATVGVAFASFVAGKGTTDIDQKHQSISASIDVDSTEFEWLGGINTVVSIELYEDFKFNSFFNPPSNALVINPTGPMFKLTGTIKGYEGKTIYAMGADNYQLNVKVTMSVDLSSTAPDGTKSLTDLDSNFVNTDTRTLALEYSESMGEGDPGHYEKLATVTEGGGYDDFIGGFTFTVTEENVKSLKDTIANTIVNITIVDAEMVAKA